MLRNLKFLFAACLLIAVLAITIHAWPTVFYVYKTYLKTTSFSQHTRNLSDVHVRKIPKRIHQSYFNFNNNSMLEKYRFAQKSWMKLNPDFTYSLWNKSMIDDLVKEHYPHLYIIYQNYQSWMNQHEIGRYVVIHRYGGIYADLDVECTGSMQSLIETAFRKKREVVLHLGDLNLAGTDFFSAPERHPFLEHIMSSLSEANKWYVIPYLSIMLTAGATFFHGCYRNYYFKGELFVLPELNEYVIHHRASSWLGWDGEIIVWFDKRRHIVKIMLLLLIACIGLKLILVLKKIKININGDRRAVLKQLK